MANYSDQSKENQFKHWFEKNLMLMKKDNLSIKISNSVLIKTKVL